jgi:hypothetical protein
MSGSPLSTPLSQLLVAFTIEFDNELDHRLVEADVGRRLPISMAMWSNFMRFVGDGITVGELPAAAGIPEARTFSTLGGMERWRYVFVSPRATGAPPRSKRDGWGSARALRREWFVRPTPVGEQTQEIAPPLFDEIESRWEERFGAGMIDELRQVLAVSIDERDVGLPEYLPIVGSSNGMRAEIEHSEWSATSTDHLSALLARVLLGYTLDFERRSELSLPLTANFVRVLSAGGLDVRDIPVAVGVSKEGTAMAVKFLAKHGYVTVDEKLIRLTAKGLEVQATAPRLHAEVERGWRAKRLRRACHGILANPRFSVGLRPYPDGWRARKRYVEQTNAVIADPTGRLPHYPLVLHRGGWPDGS